MKFSRETEEALRQSGWTPGRFVSVEPFVMKFEAEGYYFNEIILNFLKSFGGLRILHPNPRVPGSVYDLQLDPVSAVDSTTKWYVETYEKRTGEQLCVIGEIYSGYMVMMMSHTGAVYAAYDDTLVRVGDSGEDALEALCTGKELEHIP